MGRTGRGLLALLLTTGLLHPVLPVLAVEEPDTVPAATDPGFGELLATPEPIDPGCDEPPCEPSERVSAGSGGFVPVTPALLEAPTALAPGHLDVPVAGVAGLPEAGDLGTVVLRLAVGTAPGPARLRVWPAGTSRPAVPTLEFDEGRAHATLVLVDVGASGEVSLHHEPAAGRQRATSAPAPVCPPETRTPTFADVVATSVHAAGIGCAAHWGIAHGYDPHTYGPAHPVRRDQMASFVARTLDAAGHTLPDADHGFTDVGGQVHATAIGQLAAAGIVRGTTDSTYAPADLVRRDQMASYLVRALQWADGTVRSADGSPFTDIEGNAHRSAIEVAADLGLTTGRTPTTYAPRDDVRRDQMATFLTRLLAEHLLAPAPPDGVNDPEVPDGPAVEVALEVLGWFPPDEQLHTLEPRRVLDTRAEVAAASQPADDPVAVVVTGGAGLPPTDAAAVVLAVGASGSSHVSGVTVWPSGTDPPEHPDLVAEPGRVGRTLVVVEPGANGTVSLRHARGQAHLTLDVLGWLPGDGAYRPVPPGELLDTRAGAGDRLAAGGSLPVAVEGRAGLPGGDGEADPDVRGPIHAVVVRLTAFDPPEGTDLRLHPAGQPVPFTPSLAAGTGAPTSALSIVPVGDETSVEVTNRGPAVHVGLTVVGFFTLPAVAAELVVPETTHILAEEQIRSLGVDGLAVLEDGADPVAEGEHLVVGITPDTPEGWLGEVTGVTTGADGTQQVRTTPALLEDVFPAGDLIVDLGASDYDVEEVSISEPDAHGRTRITTTARSRSGVSVDYTYEGKAEGSCDFTGLEVQLGPTIDMAFRVRWRWFKAPVVTALATVGAEASVALDGVSVACDLDLDLLKATVSFAAGPVPVVVVFELGATLGLSAGLAGLDLAAGASAGVVIGVVENRGYSSGYAEFHAPSFDELMLRARDLRAYAMVDTWLHLTVKLYSVIGPRISIGPFLEMVLTTNPARPWWWMDLGVAGRVELKLDLWFKKWSWKLLEAELPLADWVGLAACTTYGPGHPGMDAYAGPCRTPAPTARPNGEVRQFAGRFRLVSAGAPLATLSIAPLTPPGGVVGQAYPAQQLVATGLFSDGVVWRVVAGSLPPGLALDAATGVLSGTPTRRGTYSATVEAWYGPVPASATQPPHGPEPPPRITLGIEVVDLRACHLTVTDPGDDGGAGQLRAAIAAVEQGDTICLEIDPEAGYVPGYYDNAVVLAAGPLIVPAGRSFTLQDRSDPPAVISGDERVQVLRLEPGAELTLVGVAIDRGSAVRGGGAHVEGGARLRLTEGSTVRYSSSDLGGGVVLFGGPTSAQRARLDLDDTSRIEFNRAGLGGGVYASYGEIRVDGGRIAGNAAESGGGIAMAEDGPGTVLLTGGAQIAGNRARYTGGGLDVVGTVTMRDTSSVRDNEAEIIEGEQGLGGGMFVRQGSVVMRESATIRGNWAYIAGGGIAIGWMGQGVTVTLHDTATITDNVIEGSGGTGGGGVYHGRDLDGQPVGTLTLNDESGVFANTPDDIDPPW